MARMNIFKQGQEDMYRTHDAQTFLSALYNPFILTSRLLSSNSLIPASRKVTKVTFSVLTVRRCCPKDSAMSARILSVNKIINPLMRLLGQSNA